MPVVNGIISAHAIDVLANARAILAGIESDSDRAVIATTGRDAARTEITAADTDFVSPAINMLTKVDWRDVSDKAIEAFATTTFVGMELDDPNLVPTVVDLTVGLVASIRQLQEANPSLVTQSEVQREGAVAYFASVLMDRVCLATDHLNPWEAELVRQGLTDMRAANQSATTIERATERLHEIGMDPAFEPIVSSFYNALAKQCIEHHRRPYFEKYVADVSASRDVPVAVAGSVATADVVRR